MVCPQDRAPQVSVQHVNGMVCLRDVCLCHVFSTDVIMSLPDPTDFLALGVLAQLVNGVVCLHATYACCCRVLSSRDLENSPTVLRGP